MLNKLPNEENKDKTLKGISAYFHLFSLTSIIPLTSSRELNIPTEFSQRFTEIQGSDKAESWHRENTWIFENRDGEVEKAESRKHCRKTRQN